MSIASSPPEEGEEIHGPGLPKRIRLSEVGQIAAERLDGGASGSLKEALALRTPDPPATVEGETGQTATPTQSRPDAAAGEIRPDEAAASGEPVERPAAVEPAEAAPAAAVAVDGWDGLPASVEPASDQQAVQPAQVAAAGADASAAPLPSLAAERIEAETELAGTPAELQDPAPVGEVDAAGPPAAANAPAFVAPPLFTAEPMPALRSFAEAHGAAHQPEIAAEGGDSTLESSPALPSPVAEGQLPAHATDPRLASARGAAARLAADASAAAEAIENLKRLLARQLPQSGELPRQPLHEIFGDPAAAMAPPPLPQQEAGEHIAEEPQPAMRTKPLPRAASQQAAWRERRQFDVRGFMAGFALSWAIGAALYIYLTAG